MVARRVGRWLVGAEEGGMPPLFVVDEDGEG